MKVFVIYPNDNDPGGHETPMSAEALRLLWLTPNLGRVRLNGWTIVKLGVTYHPLTGEEECEIELGERDHG